MPERDRTRLLLLLVLALPARPAMVSAQDNAASVKAAPPTANVSGIVTFTTQEDHRDMQKQLGITKLRPGPGGNPIRDTVTAIGTRCIDSFLAQHWILLSLQRRLSDDGVRTVIVP